MNRVSMTDLGLSNLQGIELWYTVYACMVHVIYYSSSGWNNNEKLFRLQSNFHPIRKHQKNIIQKKETVSKAPKLSGKTLWSLQLEPAHSIPPRSSIILLFCKLYLACVYLAEDHFDTGTDLLCLGLPNVNPNHIWCCGTDSEQLENKIHFICCVHLQFQFRILLSGLKLQTFC